VFVCFLWHLNLICRSVVDAVHCPQIYWDAVPYLCPFQYHPPSLMESERAADQARTEQKEKEAERHRVAATATMVAAEEGRGATVADAPEAPVPAVGKTSSRRPNHDPEVRMPFCWML
jgi:hypothetical protein